MFINEDFFDDVNTEQISTDGVEDISSSSVDLSLYKTVISIRIIRPETIQPSLEELKYFIKRLTYVLTASSMIRELSEPVIKEYSSQTDSPYLSPEEAYKLDEYSISFGTRISANSLTRFYNFLNYIFFKLHPNVKAVRIFKFDITDKRYFDYPLAFSRYDFTANRREEDFIRRMHSFCKYYLNHNFDYDELKHCMGLNTIKQLKHVSLSDYDSWSIKEIKLSQESYSAHDLPRRFFFNCQRPKFFHEPDFEKMTHFGNDNSQTESIIKFCQLKEDIKVYPQLYIAKKGKAVKLLFRFLFDKTMGSSQFYESFGFMWEHKLSIKDDKDIVPLWIGTYLWPYVCLGEDIDYLLKELAPVLTKFMTTTDIYVNVKKYATWQYKD